MISNWLVQRTPSATGRIYYGPLVRNHNNNLFKDNQIKMQKGGHSTRLQTRLFYRLKYPNARRCIVEPRAKVNAARGYRNDDRLVAGTVQLRRQKEIDRVYARLDLDAARQDQASGDGYRSDPHGYRTGRYIGDTGQIQPHVAGNQ